MDRKFVDTKQNFKQIRPKLIKSALIINILVIILVIIAVAVDKWVIVVYPHNYSQPILQKEITHTSFGVMSFCYYERNFDDSIPYKHCTSFWLMPTKRQISKDPFTDDIVAGLRQTEFVFLVIMSFSLMVSFGSGLYSVRVYRYMYKRFTAVMYLISAICMMVCIELVNNIVRHCRETEGPCYPPTSRHYFVMSMYIMWICFCCLLICSALFLICSSKLKGANAADEREALENTPFELGR